MTITAPNTGATRAVATTDWEALAAAVHGRLVLPEHPDWEGVRSPWLVNVDQRPAAVLEVTAADDIVRAVQWAAARGVPVSAQPGGHGARTTLDGTLLLRTRALNDVTVDVVRRTARVGAGVKWTELLHTLDGTGLIALAGSTGDTSVVGLTLGGGLSWFSRKHGFAANSVIAVDLVDADGSLSRVTRTSDPDLFWALRGGGGDFGIVVAMELALYPAPELYGGRLLWPIELARPVLRAFRHVAEAAPRELTLWAHLYHFPPLAELPEEIRGRSFASVAVMHIGGAVAAEWLIRSLRSVGPPVLDTMGPVPIGDLGDVADEPTEPTPVVEYSSLLPALTDDTIDTLIDAVGEPGCPLPVVQVRALGGAFADPHPGHGAVGHVTEPYQLFALGIPAVPALVGPIKAAIDGLDAAVAAVASLRRLANFVGEDQDHQAAHEPATLARLRDIKRARDPRGVIRSNKPVLRPAR